jgi:dienelactone hydrolase
MSESAVYRPHPEGAAIATLRDGTATDAWAGLRAQRFELVSRGDFVPGILYRNELADQNPEAASPLLLIQHATADGADADYLACAAPWAKKGLAVASVDLPLHGTRSSPKLSARLIDGIRQLACGRELDLESWALVEEFARQATSDLIRTLDALSTLPGIDGGRIGFMGFGLGAIAGSYLLAHDPRPRTVVLAGVGGGGGGRSDLDPATYLDRTKELAPTTSNAREILIVAAEGDERVSKNEVDTLFEAAPEPKELLRSRGRSRALPKQTLAKIEAFLSRTLEF